MNSSASLSKHYTAATRPSQDAGPLLGRLPKWQPQRPAAVRSQAESPVALPEATPVADGLPMTAPIGDWSPLRQSPKRTSCLGAVFCASQRCSSGRAVILPSFCCGKSENCRVGRAKRAPPARNTLGLVGFALLDPPYRCFRNRNYLSSRRARRTPRDRPGWRILPGGLTAAEGPREGRLTIGPSAGYTCRDGSREWSDPSLWSVR